MREVRRHDVGGTGGQGLVRGQVWRPGARGAGEKMESGTSRFLPWASGGHCRVLLRVYCAPDPDASSSWWRSGGGPWLPPQPRDCVHRPDGAPGSCIGQQLQKYPLLAAST